MDHTPEPSGLDHRSPDRPDKRAAHRACRVLVDAARGPSAAIALPILPRPMKPRPLRATFPPQLVACAFREQLRPHLRNGKAGLRRAPTARNCLEVALRELDE